MLIVNRRIRIPDEELQFTFARSGGPGGQNVNKVNTKAVLHWDVTRSTGLPDDVRSRFLARYSRRITAEGSLVLTSQRYRTQLQNLADCRSKLAEMLAAVATAPVVRKATKPSKAVKRRRLEEKRHESAKKQSRRAGRSGRELD
ncbi:MAG: aminoacyl-tRNA hydrolase [Pirellulales bacterium]|nr:aminoacyl-tRNA hydrolase [Pirellulales bacterium]